MNPDDVQFFIPPDRPLAVTRLELLSMSSGLGEIVVAIDGTCCGSSLNYLLAINSNALRGGCYGPSDVRVSVRDAAGQGFHPVELWDVSGNVIDLAISKAADALLIA